MIADQAKHVETLVERVKPILAGEDPAVQGAVVAELVSLWLAGHHPPALRERLLRNHVDCVRALTKFNARALHGE